MKKISILAAALLASTSAPAFAATIVYTLSGTFTGTLDGNPFTTGAVFTGSGDTTTTTNGFGNSNVLAVPVPTFTANSNGGTFQITNPSFFYIYGPGQYGETNRRLGFAFDNSGNNALGLESASFNGYSGLTSFSNTSGTTYFQNAQFGTDRGAVTITGFTDGTFSASAVPEPATWAMLLLGFGMIGFAMRKRSNVRTTVRYA